MARSGFQVKKRVFVQQEDFVLLFLKVKGQIHHFGLDRIHCPGPVMLICIFRFEIFVVMCENVPPLIYKNS